MPNFVLVDHWLADVGGHNYQYAVDILTAAEECGYQPVLALRRQFSRTAEVPSTWRVFRVFQFGPKHAFSAGVDGKSRRGIGLDGRWLDAASVGWTARILDLVRCADRRRHLQDFESACQAVFSEIGFHAEDIAFLTTMSDFDLLGLVRFLRGNPDSLQLAWHVQMHFDIFTGREPCHASQTDRRDLIRRQMSCALAQVPAHRLHFYSTTDEMCRQYNRLGVVKFQTLPYPTRAAHAQTTPPQTCALPLRLTLAGSARREKGKRQLGQLVRMLWDEFLSPGQVQLWLQLSPSDLHRQLPKDALAVTHVTSDVREATDAPLVAVKHPLPSGDYNELIRRSDVGMFLYDSERYHSRCSGILVEMLSAGVPVIVPAGSWLSEQIADVAYEHLDRLQRQGNVIQQIDVPGRQWRAGHPASPDAVSGRRQRRLGLCPAPVRTASQSTLVACGPEEEPALVEVPLPAGATQVIISFCWASDNPPGAYLRVETSDPEQAAGDGPVANVAVVGSRHAPGPVHVLAALEPNQTKLRLRLQDAYDRMPLHVSDVQVTFLAASAGRNGYPRAQVGIAVADVSQVPTAVREMIVHRQHYRRSAWEYSRLWNAVHAPRRTVEILQANR